jgi:GNAT superfamily N-acetyltransferase
VADGFHVRYVSDDEALKEWTQVSSEGFGGDVQMCHDAYARHGFGSDAFSLHTIGYLGDEPVTSSTLLLAGGIAGIYDVSTPPRWRRQGFASAITHDAMQEAHSRGYEHAWIMPSPMGRSVYAKLGFVGVDFGIREYLWRQR